MHEDGIAPKGLRGLVVAETEIGDVRGGEGFYHYRQYSAPELAATRSFEDVWHLLFEGTLPTRAQRRSFADELAAHREVPDPVRALLPGIAATHDPMTGLRTALSALAAADRMLPTHQASATEVRAQAVRLCAVTPVLVGALHRLAAGLEPVAPRDDLGHVAGYLYAVDGEVPDARRARALEQYLVLAVDHGFNASTFTARVVTSTGADVGAALVAALGALSGPLHGGAPSRALDTLDEIGSPESAEEWVRRAVSRGDRIMGFGHAVYRTADPRAVMLRDVARRFGGPLVELAELVESTVESVLAELKPGRELHTNVEYYAGVVMALCGLDRSLFTPTFAVSRVVGWSAQVLEQHAQAGIIRPSVRYVGPAAPQPVPVAV